MKITYIFIPTIKVYNKRVSQLKTLSKIGSLKETYAVVLLTFIAYWISYFLQHFCDRSFRKFTIWNNWYPVSSRTVTTGSWSSAKNILFLFFISTLQQCTIDVLLSVCRNASCDIQCHPEKPFVFLMQLHFQKKYVCLSCYSLRINQSRYHLM